MLYHTQHFAAEEADGGLLSQDFFLLPPPPLRFKVRFLADFVEKTGLRGVPSNQLGMIEQVVISHGRTFTGTFYSSFSAHVFRHRLYLGKVGGVFVAADVVGVSIVDEAVAAVAHVTAVFIDAVGIVVAVAIAVLLFMSNVTVVDVEMLLMILLLLLLLIDVVAAAAATVAVAHVDGVLVRHNHRVEQTRSGLRSKHTLLHFFAPPPLISRGAKLVLVLSLT